MPFKQTIEIDVDDSRFKEFHKNFEKYQAALGKLPKAWAAQEKGTKATKANLADMTAAIMAQQEMLAKTVKEQERLDRATQSSGRSMGTLARAVERVAGGLRSATSSLLRWGTLTGLASGLLGAGSLFGISGAAGSVYSMRRSAGGLGTTVGQERAFGLNYGQFVDTGSVLGNIAGAKSDLSKRWAFAAAGVNQQGKDPATLATELISRARTLYGQNQTEQFAQAHGLTQFFSMEDLRRIGSAPNGALSAARMGYGKDVGTLGLAQSTQEAWNKLDIQLRRASATIETSFIRGLERVTPSIDKLSVTFTNIVDKLFSSDKLQGWLDSLDRGLGHFAEYLGSDRFANDAKSFADGVASVARALVWLAGKVPGGGEAVPGSTGPNSYGAFPSLGIRTSRFGDKPIHNALNLRPAGRKTGFRQFDTDLEGATAAADQLRSYYNDRHLDTISGIVGRWATNDPNDPNDRAKVAAYIRAVAGRTGYGADQHLNLNNDVVLVKLMDAMARQEGNGKVIIEILNNTGGAAIVNAAQLPQ